MCCTVDYEIRRRRICMLGVLWLVKTWELQTEEEEVIRGRRRVIMTVVVVAVATFTQYTSSVSVVSLPTD